LVLFGISRLPQLSNILTCSLLKILTDELIAFFGELPLLGVFVNSFLF
jgi:hypothetical protein